MSRGWRSMHGNLGRRADGLARRRVALGWFLCAFAVLLAVAQAAGAETVTRTFTAQEEAFVVPQGVTSIQVVAIGGEGGSDELGASGGEGARVTGTLSVTAGSTLYVHVGGAGTLGNSPGKGGGGGGASDVRTAPLSAGLSPDPRLIVAAGGGGAGGIANNSNERPAPGGNAEERGFESALAEAGEPGTQTAGGEGGFGYSTCGTSAAENGSLEHGGKGGYCLKNTTRYEGGGGGAGLYGGGGGGAGNAFNIENGSGEAGGGGGSSLVPAGGTKSLAGASAPQVQVSYEQPANPPAVVTGSASHILEVSATVSGTVNPEHEEVTSCTFQYGETEAYGQSAACSPAPGAGIAPVAVSASLSGLSGATTYHYRVVATNGSGTSYGTDHSFTTLPQEPPTVTGVSPSEGPTAGGTSVTITGTNLENASAVDFGSSAAGSYTVESPTTIKAVAPAGMGTVDVTVTTPAGATETSSADRYTYVAAPSATTELATGITQTGATLNGRVTSTAAFSDCHFEYGTTPSYGTSVACSSLPPTGTSPVSASVTGLTPDTLYHFRVSVTNVGGTTVGADRTFATGGAPEYGRCLKVTTGTGHYGTATCTTGGGKSNYEWYPAFGGAKPLVKTHFTLAIKALSTLTLAYNRGSIKCTGQTGTGEYTGNKTIGNVLMRFTGCTWAAYGKCTSSGAAEGELVVAALKGELGVIKVSSEGPAKNTIGTDLRAESGEVWLEAVCGPETATVTGAAIGEVKRDAMVSTAPIKYTEKTGVQNPKQFVGGPTETLFMLSSPPFSPGETAHEARIVLTTNQTDEEKVEINSVV